MDIPMSNLFGHKPAPLQSQHICRCNARDPRVYNKYNKLLDSYLETHRLHQHMYQLEWRACYPLPTDMRLEAENIDRLYMQGHQYADKRCRRIVTGGTACTPEYNKILSKIMLFKTLLRLHIQPTTPPSDRVLCKYLRRSQILDPLAKIKQASYTQLKRQLSEAYKEMRRYRKSDFSDGRHGWQECRKNMTEMIRHNWSQ